MGKYSSSPFPKPLVTSFLRLLFLLQFRLVVSWRHNNTSSSLPPNSVAFVLGLVLVVRLKLSIKALMTLVLDAYFSSCVLSHLFCGFRCPAIVATGWSVGYELEVVRLSALSVL